MGAALSFMIYPASYTQPLLQYFTGQPCSLWGDSNAVDAGRWESLGARMEAGYHSSPSNLCHDLGQVTRALRTGTTRGRLHLICEAPLGPGFIFLLNERVSQ